MGEGAAAASVVVWASAELIKKFMGLPKVLENLSLYSTFCSRFAGNRDVASASFLGQSGLFLPETLNKAGQFTLFNMLAQFSHQMLIVVQVMKRAQLRPKHFATLVQMV